MIIGSAQDFSSDKTVRVFRQSRPYVLALTVGFLLAVGFFFSLCFFAYPKPENPPAFVVAILVGMLFGVGTLASGREAISAFRSEAWVMKVTREGILIQFRSLNRQGRPEDDGGVVWIDRSEIKAIGEYSDTRTSHPVKDDSTNEDTARYLEIRLNHDRSGELRREIQREQTASKRDVWVWIAAPDLIRVRFRSPLRMIRPGMLQALKTLGAWYPALPRRDVRLKDWRKLTPYEARAYAAMMSDRGLVDEAAGVLSYQTGIDPATAREQVKTRMYMLAGLCPHCGYDLQATSKRCPECGRLTGSVPT